MNDRTLFIRNSLKKNRLLDNCRAPQNMARPLLCKHTVSAREDIWGVSMREKRVSARLARSTAIVIEKLEAKDSPSILWFPNRAI